MKVSARWLTTLLLLTCACSPEPASESGPAEDLSLPWGDSLSTPDQVENPDASRSDGEYDDGLGVPDSTTDANPAAKTCKEFDLACGTWANPDWDQALWCGACAPGEFCSNAGQCSPEPDCSIGAWRFWGVDINGQGDGPELHAGQLAAAIVHWEAGNPTGCNGCARNLVVGLQQHGEAAVYTGAFTCLELPPLQTCPATTEGYSAVQFVAAEPGEYTLFAEILKPGTACHDWPYQLPHHHPSATALTTLTIAPACEPESCAAMAHHCGTWSDGCGGLVQCGACAPGMVCDPQGVCSPAEPCELDTFSINEVLIDGFKNFVEKGIGEPFPLLLSWSLGNQESLAGTARQIVIGLDNQPHFCIDAQTPQDCPAFSTGLASGTLTAPLQAGAYAVQAAAVAADSCLEAPALYAASQPRLTLGTVVVNGNCQATSCGALLASCGLHQDGCGSILDCGDCAPQSLCQAGHCTTAPACGGPVIDLAYLDVAGQGSTATVGAGSLVPITFAWLAASGDECPNCVRQLVFGLQGQPVHCVELGKLPVCPATTTGVHGAFMAVPPTPGQDLLRVALTDATDCAQAFEFYAYETTIPVASLTVEGGCQPYSCDSLGRDCGDWSDGCGGFLHCGSCPDDQTCSSQGQCLSPCAEGVLQLTDIAINGSGSLASAAPGTKASVTMTWLLGNPDDCPDCPRFAVVGIGSEAQQCKSAGTPPTCPDVVAGQYDTHVTAPETPGAYKVNLLVPHATSCDDAMAQYESTSERKILATLQVTDGCLPKSCINLGKKCGTWPDGCGFDLTCGSCEPAQLCSENGQCYCGANDPYEPNDTPVTAHHLGSFTDQDGASHVTLVGGLEDEADWFRVSATDVQWAYLEPFVEVFVGDEEPFTVTLIYGCQGGFFPNSFNELNTAGCTLRTDLPYPNLVPGETKATGWTCESDGSPVLLQVGPQCALLDDSGEFFVGVQKYGECSSFTLDMHL